MKFLDRFKKSLLILDGNKISEPYFKILMDMYGPVRLGHDAYEFWISARYQMKSGVLFDGVYFFDDTINSYINFEKWLLEQYNCKLIVHNYTETVWIKFKTVKDKTEFKEKCAKIELMNVLKN